MSAHNELRALLSKPQLSGADKSKIHKAYQLEFKRKAKTSTTCGNCYYDAIIEILANKDKATLLKPGEIVEYLGQFYNRHDDLPKELISKIQNNEVF
jgi:hypothetical protein